MLHRSQPNLNRRDFLKTGSLAAVAAALGGALASGGANSARAQPAATGTGHVDVPGKRGLQILSDRPWNAETPVTLLDADITPTEHHVDRNDGHVPARATKRDLAGWKLTIDGEVRKPLELSLDALQRDFPRQTRALVLEC